MENRSVRAFVILACLVSFSRITGQQLATADPESGGYSSSFFKTFGKQLNDSIPCLGAFIVYRYDKIIYERYFHGADSTDAFSIKSITKSVVSALAGIAKSKGLLPELNTPVVKFFPELVQPRTKASTVWFRGEKAWNDSVRNTLTLYDLLTMQHGWDWNDFQGSVNIFINAADPIRFTMDIPFADTPGTRFVYSSAAASLFGAALEKSVHTSLKNFAEKNLLAPLGMHCPRWDTDPQGRSIGCSEMFLTARDLLRFGRLYLHGGKEANQQIIPKDWIEASTKQQARLDYWDILPGANGYGYYWWRRKTNEHQAWVASGAGGQIITIIPDMDMVIVATCLFNKPNRGREEIRRIHEFVDLLTKPN